MQTITTEAAGPTLHTYLCDDGNAEIEIVAESPRAAAREYAEAYDPEDSTSWIDVRVVEVDDEGEEVEDHDWITVEIEPTEPECAEDHDHEWESPCELLGGIEDNPGCWGHGGGVVYTEVCRHCGTYRTTDTWAQRMDTGEQGLTAVSYREADSESRAWARLVGAYDAGLCRRGAIAAMAVIDRYRGDYVSLRGVAPRAVEVCEYLSRVRSSVVYGDEDRAVRLALVLAIAEARRDGGDAERVANYVAEVLL